MCEVISEDVNYYNEKVKLTPFKEGGSSKKKLRGNVDTIVAPNNVIFFKELS